MKKVKNKKNLFILILLIVISSTVAYLYSSDTFQNIFVAASYKVTVVETFESPTNWKPGDTTPKTATLKNEGTVPIKVRVKLEEEWKDSNNQDLPLQHNEENVAIINLSNEDDYIYKDGYYYYDLALNPGETTSSIIESVTFNPNYSGTVTCVENDDSTHTCSSSESGYEGGTYKLTLTIEGVQEDYYVQAWGIPGKVGRQDLYNVIMDEAENNGLAKKYTGSHHDSFNTEPSKDVYYWHANNSSQVTSVNNMNNVVFGKHCWQIIRTTDTGGVKLKYNGLADNNTCSTIVRHEGYSGVEYGLNLDGNYWYGTDFNFDSSTKKYSITGDLEQARWDDSTYQSLIGKYTCKKTTESDTCSTLYLIHSYYFNNRATAIKLYSNFTSSYGEGKYNTKSSPTHVGYMYGNDYSNTISFNPQQSLTEERTFNIVSVNNSISYYYSDDVVYDPILNKYQLLNPYKLEGNSPDYSGKYTMFSSSSSSTVYYMISNRLGIMLTNGETKLGYDPMIIGDSIADNNDGTYSIVNPITTSLYNYYMNYADYEDKYTCVNSLTCSNPHYIISTERKKYAYVPCGEKILIAKGRNGLNLIDNLLVTKGELTVNRSNYTDYKYTCNDTNSSCTESNLRMIHQLFKTGYTYIPNYYFGSDVSWDGTNYTLLNTIGLEHHSDRSGELSTHHYFCLSPGLKTCSEVGYMYYYSGGTTYYMLLSNGMTLEQILHETFDSNNNESVIKIVLERWYEKYMLEYDDYIEDTIYCNNRNITNLGGFDSNGGSIASNPLSFQTDYDLNCLRDIDKFCVSNNMAKTNYKVGLLTVTDINLVYANYYKMFLAWSMTPKSVSDNSYMYSLDKSSIRPYDNYSLYPSISLKPGVKFMYGDGSKENPFVVDTN